MRIGGDNVATNSIKAKTKMAMLCMTRQCWEQGIAAQALMEINDMERLSLLVHDIVLRQSDDGRLCNIENTPAITDSSFCVPATLKMAAKEHKPHYHDAVGRNVAFLLHDAPRTDDKVIYHMFGTKEIWADSAAFTPLALASMGHYREAADLMKGLQSKLYDPESKLYYHMWDEDTQEHIRKLFWGIGNGWILTGLLRLYLEMPAHLEKDRADILASFTELLNTMLSYETDNHLFYDVLDDSSTFEETEVSEMVAYSIFRAVKENVIEESFLCRAYEIRTAVYGKITENGLLLDCASSPEFIKPGTSVEGQAHFLMMEEAFERL